MFLQQKRQPAPWGVCWWLCLGCPGLTGGDSVKENSWDLVAGECAHGLDVAAEVLFFPKTCRLWQEETFVLASVRGFTQLQSHFLSFRQVAC